MTKTYTSYILFSFLLFSVAYTANDVIVKNLKLFVGGNEFFIKGMCYSPTPLGVTNNGGFCSYKETPFGDYQPACYDSDYFDGSGDNPQRSPPGPPGGGWFQAVWNRDFPNLQQLGVNTVRLYSANPSTRQATIANVTGTYKAPMGKSHVQFMDTANSYGIKVIFPLLGDQNLMTQYTASQYEQYLMNQINEIGNHPALLMWTVGNELPLNGDSNLIALVNRYMDFARSYTLSKWGRIIPVTTAVVDLPDSYDALAAALHVDVFTTNAGYRGFNYQDLWSGNSQTIGWYRLSCKYNIPLFIGEVGWLSDHNSVDYQYPNWFNQKYQDQVAHTDQGCIGSAFFEYQDEMTKEDSLQQNLGVVSVSVNTVNGQSSNQPNVWLADIATPKPILYNSLINGSVNGVPYNYQTSVYSLLGRQQWTLSNVPNVCSSLTTGTSATSASSGQATRSTTASSATQATQASSTSASTQATTITKVTSSTAAQATTGVQASSSSTIGVPTTSSTSKAVTSTTAQASTTAQTSTTAQAQAASSSQASTTAKVSSTRATTTAQASSTLSANSATTSRSSSTQASATATTGSSSTTGSNPTCTRYCGSDSCCQTTPTGNPTCYNPSLYTCLNTGSTQTLCGSTLHNGQRYFDGVCGTGCYDSYCYTCSNNALAPTGKC